MALLGFEVFFFLIFFICGMVVGLTQKGFRKWAFVGVFILLAYSLDKITYSLLFLLSLIISSEIKNIFINRKQSMDDRKTFRI